jgi:nitrate reductase cytochrome c-type subunit
LKKNPFKLLIGSFSLFLFLGIIFLCLQLYPSKVSVDEVFPQEKWARVIDSIPNMKEIGSLRAENCSSCHEDIYNEWKTSTHSMAYKDVQFQSELSKESSPKWLCLNCHLPVSNQREYLVNFLIKGDFNRPVEEKNKNYDEKMRMEGVTCATCHIKLDENGDPYILGANGNTSPPHPVKIDKEKLRNRCLDCHNVTYQLNEGLVCYFQTGKEMLEDNNVHPLKDCASCHMPEVTRSFVKLEMKKTPKISHKHGFIGGGVPKSFDLYPAQIENGYKRGIELERFQRIGNQIQIIIKNKSAKHYVPTGDPERFMQVNLFWKDKSNSILAHEKHRIGQEWEWSPKAKIISDNRLKVNESREVKFDLPANAKEAVTVELIIQHVRLKEATSNYMTSTAHNVSEAFKESVQNLKEIYPHSSIILKAELDLQKEKFLETPIKELFLLNGKQRGVQWEK